MKLLRAEEDGLPQKLLSICIHLSLEMGVLDESLLLPTSSSAEALLTLLKPDSALFPVEKDKT